MKLLFAYIEIDSAQICIKYSTTIMSAIS